jgi:hypothetical protein
MTFSMEISNDTCVNDGEVLFKENFLRERNELLSAPELPQIISAEQFQMTKEL